MVLRDYYAAVDCVDRDAAEGRGDKTVFYGAARNLTCAELRDARLGRIFRSIAKPVPRRSWPGDRAPMWRDAAYSKVCVNWRWAC
jgi:hypothetical protein